MTNWYIVVWDRNVKHPNFHLRNELKPRVRHSRLVLPWDSCERNHGIGEIIWPEYQRREGTLSEI
jgi:hypothetical protein